MLLETIKTHLESLSPEQRYDVDSKAESLHTHWIELKDLVLKRVDCVNTLIEFYDKVQQLIAQINTLQMHLSKAQNFNQSNVFEDNWQKICGDFALLKDLGERFLHWKVSIYVFL